MYHNKVCNEYLQQIPPPQKRAIICALILFTTQAEFSYLGKYINMLQKILTSADTSGKINKTMYYTASKINCPYMGKFGRKRQQNTESCAYMK